MRVWVIRGGPGNRLVDEFIDQSVIGVGYYTVPDARSLSRRDMESLLRQEGTSAAVEWHAAMLDHFVHHMAISDIVIMPDTPRGEVVVGDVAGEYRFHEELPAERYRHRRRMSWLGRHRIADLPAGRQNLYKQRETLSELTDPADVIAHADRVRRGDVGRPANDRRTTAGRRPAGAAGESRQAERRCGSCFQMLATSAFPTADAACCRSCSDE